nr:MAG TPA_asm: putative transcriptional regulator [Caudoviricetes sp.]
MTIRELRARTGLTQAAFAAALHIPKRSVENWEGGVNTPPAYLVELIEYRVTHDPDLTGSCVHDKMHVSGGKSPVY